MSESKQVNESRDIVPIPKVGLPNSRDVVPTPRPQDGTKSPSDGAGAKNS